MENHYYQVIDRNHPDGVLALAAFLGWMVLEAAIHKTVVVQNLKGPESFLFLLEIDPSKQPQIEGLVSVNRFGCLYATNGLPEKLFG